MPSFRFSLPSRENLTRTQKLAIDDDNPIFTTGIPGSGKTVVAVYRIARLKNNSRLFTYTRMLTVAINGTVNVHLREASNKISSIYQWFASNCHVRLGDIIHSEESVFEVLKSQEISFNEIIFDEAQDLPISLYSALNKVCNNISIGADNAQQIFRGGSDEEELSNIFIKNKPHELDENFRNTFEIFNFSKNFVVENERAQNSNMLNQLKLKRRGDKPTIFLYKMQSDIVSTLHQILNDNKGSNTGILLVHTQDVDTYYNLITHKTLFDCSYYYNGMPIVQRDNVERNLKNILVTTFKSAKGMEFDTVIIPELQLIDEEIKIQFFVGCTRAKSNLFLFCKDSLPKIIDSPSFKDSYTIQVIEKSKETVSIPDPHDFDLPF